MLKKVTNPAQKVTDPVLIKELARQGIDKDFVKFTQDYAPRLKDGKKVKERSPYAKFYQDMKSGRRFMVVSNLPMVNADGVRVDVGWELKGQKCISKANQFTAEVKDKSVTLKCINDQPDVRKKNDKVEYSPLLFLNDVEQIGGEVSLLSTDPENENYQNNVLEWDYGICKRRIRIIEGRFRERWIFTSNPNGEVRVKHNFKGNFHLKLGTARDANGENLEVQVINDEEIIPSKEFNRPDIEYPIEIGASSTFYPDASPESSSVDGETQHSTGWGSGGILWATLIASAGSGADDSSNDALGFYDRNGATANRYSAAARAAALFDTSGLHDGAKISAAVLSFRGSSKADSIGAGANAALNIYSVAPASNTALAAGDFDSFGATAYCDSSITYNSWDITDYNDYAFNATGIAAIDKTGVSKFGTRDAYYDVGATSPPYVGANLACQVKFWTADKGAGYKPKLVVTYTVPVSRHGFVNFQNPGIV